MQHQDDCPVYVRKTSIMAEDCKCLIGISITWRPNLGVWAASINGDSPRFFKNRGAAFWNIMQEVISNFFASQL